jgi:hypothetical protein
MLLSVVSSAAMAAPEIIAKGELKFGGKKYERAVATYDFELDDSGVGTNPGLEVWADKTLTKRLISSKDDNALWNYSPEAAFFEDGELVVLGLRDSIDGFVSEGRVWRSNRGAFLKQTPAQFGYLNDTTTPGIFQAGLFNVEKRCKRYSAYVEHNQNDDYAQTGAYPSLTVREEVTGAVLFEARDDNATWDYSVFIAFAFEGKLYMTGARRDNATGQFFPRIWTTEGAVGSRLRQRKNGL